MKKKSITEWLPGWKIQKPRFLKWTGRG